MGGGASRWPALGSSPTGRGHGRGLAGWGGVWGASGRPEGRRRVSADFAGCRENPRQQKARAAAVAAARRCEVKAKSTALR